jgi:hypothetical protein
MNASYRSRNGVYDEVAVGQHSVLHLLIAIEKWPVRREYSLSRFYPVPTMPWLLSVVQQAVGLAATPDGHDQRIGHH